jgi:hypothetical protein
MDQRAAEGAVPIAECGASSPTSQAWARAGARITLCASANHSEVFAMRASRDAGGARCARTSNSGTGPGPTSGWGNAGSGLSHGPVPGGAGHAGARLPWWRR